MSDSETRPQAQVPKSKRIIVAAILGDDIAVVGQYHLRHHAVATLHEMRSAYPGITFTTCTGNATYGRDKLARYVDDAAKRDARAQPSFEVIRVKKRAFAGAMR